MDRVESSGRTDRGLWKTVPPSKWWVEDYGRQCLPLSGFRILNIQICVSWVSVKLMDKGIPTQRESQLLFQSQLLLFGDFGDLACVPALSGTELSFSMAVHTIWASLLMEIPLLISNFLPRGWFFFHGVSNPQSLLNSKDWLDSVGVIKVSEILVSAGELAS